MSPRKSSAAPKLTPGLEEELRERLEKTLDEIDDVSDKRRRISKKLGGYLKVLGENKDLIRRQLKGYDLDQLELPGTHQAEPSKDPLIADILKLAGGIVSVKTTPEGADDVEPLVWRGAPENGEIVANVIGGTYRIEQCQGTREGWTAKWNAAAGHGRSKLLAISKPLDECKEACRTHHLDRAADDMIEKDGRDV